MDFFPTRTVDSPLGPLHLCARSDGLAALLFDGDRTLEERLEEALRGGPGKEPAEVSRAGRRHLEAASRWLDRYFAGRDPDARSLALSPAGTLYELRVWRALLRIPRGEVRTYAEVAATAGGSPRAVGNACGKNPIAIVCPCHRVVAAGGALGGFGSGLWRKQKLLALEGAGTFRSRGSA